MSGALRTRVQQRALRDDWLMLPVALRVMRCRVGAGADTRHTAAFTMLPRAMALSGVQQSYPRRAAYALQRYRCGARARCYENGAQARSEAYIAR